MSTCITPAVVGATGYAGFELTRILLRHKFARKPVLLRREAGEGASPDLAEMYPQVAGNGSLPLEAFSWERLKQSGADVLFLCTPHELSRACAAEALDHGLRVVDLSGAWRLKQAANRAVYAFTDADPARAAELDASAAFGIPELHRDQIKSAQLVANAGCYATSIILALAPWVRAGLVDVDHGIICDSKSGVSGAGKQPTTKTHFVEAADNLSAYSVFGHRHTGEILEQVGLTAEQLQFTPHLLPIPRGILSTIYLRLKAQTSAAELDACLREFYAGSAWVRVFGHGRLPQIKFSLNTNYCDIGFSLAPDGRRVVLVSCLDNLLKGAAGQAVQNMNVMFGWDEREGLQ
ncbi:MAG TPA: N-acetyl-gamma-glutamyl-phosphate reductase [Terriglobales bacterium]|jgi:N-acetyl-gamma-glutamyl-phosphate reductase|nr:N-acetyl-gamma-glutamyl-phosphate reductase [Terriglobales bacterium]